MQVRTFLGQIRLGQWQEAGCPWAPTMDPGLLEKTYVGSAHIEDISGFTGIKRVQLWIGSFTSEMPGVVGIQVHVVGSSVPHISHYHTCGTVIFPVPIWYGQQWVVVLPNGRVSTWKDLVTIMQTLHVHPCTHMYETCDVAGPLRSTNCCARPSSSSMPIWLLFAIQLDTSHHNGYHHDLLLRMSALALFDLGEDKGAVLWAGSYAVL
jgi:hypothetical protein